MQIQAKGCMDFSKFKYIFGFHANLMSRFQNLKSKFAYCINIILKVVLGS